jgi:hypothetical protein
MLCNAHCSPQQEYEVKVWLAGPDDLGYWFLDNENGYSFPLVEQHEDHPKAAQLFGWATPEGVTDEEAIIQDALDWLMDHIGDAIEAPQEAANFFRELTGDDEDEQED